MQGEAVQRPREEEQLEDLEQVEDLPQGGASGSVARRARGLGLPGPSRVAPYTPSS